MRRTLWAVVIVAISAAGCNGSSEDRLATRMQAGLDALYQQKDPESAIAHFREVLEGKPDHYGATFQLAAALQRAGRTEEARVQWDRSLEMARAIKDQPTIDLIASLRSAPTR